MPARATREATSAALQSAEIVVDATYYMAANTTTRWRH
jgi:hypothetical protein